MSKETSPIIPVLQRGLEPNVDADRGPRKAFYDRIHAHVDATTPVEAFEIPAGSGRAWTMKAGQACRILITHGPQVADFNAWSAQNPRERFWAARTRQIHGPHVNTYDRLWSCLPYLRPMLTITRETIEYGLDADGGGCHDLLGSRCDPYGHMLLTGQHEERTCHSNLTHAVRPFGLHEEDVHDVLNIFQITGVTRTDNICFVKASPARVGDYFEFFAEIDLLCAVSACPQGDLSAPVSGPEAEAVGSRCHPLGIEVYDVDSALLTDWERSQPVPFHGLLSARKPA